MQRLAVARLAARGSGGGGLDHDEILGAAGRFAGIAPVAGVEAVEPQPLTGRRQNEFGAPLRRLR